MIILYPNNKAYHDYRSQECVGTNETYNIPAERKAPFGKTPDDAEIYYFNGEQIKAFYTGYNYDERNGGEWFRYYRKLEFQREIAKRQHRRKLEVQENIKREYTIRNSKRSNAISNLLERVEKKQALI